MSRGRQDFSTRSRDQQVAPARAEPTRGRSRGTGPHRHFACITLALACCAAASAQPRVDADFPGGNIVVERIEGDQVYLYQDLRDTRGDWFYWSFRVQGAAGRRLTFQFTRSRAIGLLGPGVSTDGGLTWRLLGPRQELDRFTYQFGADEQEVRFSFGMPYQVADLNRFLERHAGNPLLQREVYGATRKGTPVELLRLGADGGSPGRYKVLITVRHHACEMMASYVAEGCVAEYLDGTGPGRWLRENTEWIVVPFVDWDGVEAGDQGKNRIPHDHKADYRGPSIYPEVAALRQFTGSWAPGKPDATLDLHNPNIDGNVIYTHALRTEGVSQPGENAGGRNREFARRFLDTLERVQRGPLPFRVQDSIAFAERMAKKRAEMPGTTAATRSDRREDTPSPRITVGFEIPYAQVHGVEVNAASARALGRDLAAALAEYLRGVERKP